jgi:hypothetical protein
MRASLLLLARVLPIIVLLGSTNPVTGQVDSLRALLKDASTPLGTPAFTFTPRGKVQAKGKGEMEMFFVRRSSEAA